MIIRSNLFIIELLQCVIYKIDFFFTWIKIHLALPKIFIIFYSPASNYKINDKNKLGFSHKMRVFADEMQFFLSDFIL